MRFHRTAYLRRRWSRPQSPSACPARVSGWGSVSGHGGLSGWLGRGQRPDDAGTISTSSGGMRSPGPRPRARARCATRTRPRKRITGRPDLPRSMPRPCTTANFRSDTPQKPRIISGRRKLSVPSKPGCEPLSQAKPSRHPEVAGYQPDPAARRPRAAFDHHRPKLRRARHRPGPGGARGPHGRHPAQKPRSRPPARTPNMRGGSAGSSSGAPAPKAGSATSSADTAGIALGWTAAEEPRSGARPVTSPQPGQDRRLAS